MAPVEHAVFLKEYTQAIRDGAAALFVGAGVSRAAGYVDWKQLLSEVADELHLDVTKEDDLVALAQYHLNQRKGRDRLNQLIVNEFTEDATLTPTHEELARLPINTVWTTNYDDLLEGAIVAAHKRVDVKRRQQDFATTRKRTDVVVYKMHGDRADPADAVLTKEDYESYDRSRGVFTIALKGDLTTKTFLFLGFSFSDPNIMYVLSRVKLLLESNSRQHYCILREPQGSGASYDYELTRFGHWLEDLHRYHLRPIIIRDYSEVPKLLFELNRRVHARDVFVSGSAADYSPLGKDKFELLCVALGRQLASSGFNIISGFGLGVGGMITVGAMQTLKRNDDERLQLWPFPQDVPPTIDRDEYLRKYREGMLNLAGGCIVVAGNKMDGGKVILANGVLQEVGIAQSSRKFVIPIGATGSVARQLWDECMKDSRPYVGDLKVGEQLSIIGDHTRSVEEIVGAVIEILKRLDK